MPVYQMGTALQNDLPKFQRNGEIRNSGGIAGDNNGVGANPFSVTDWGQLGFCSNSAPTGGPYAQICIGHDASGNGVLSVDSLNGEPNHHLVLQLNGQPIATPGVASGPTCANILAYGAVPDDATDNTPAWNAAKAASRCIAFPAGIFRFNSPLTYAFTGHLQGLAIRGQGQDLTVLHWPATVGTALAITKTELDQSVHISDLTMTTGTHNADYAIAVSQTKGSVGATVQAGFASNDITRVTFRADDAYTMGGTGAPSTTTKSWKRGIWIYNDSVWDFVGVMVYGPTPPPGSARTNPEPGGGAGDGIVLEGGSSTMLPVVFNIDRANIQWVENGVRILPWVQGVNIMQSNFTGNFTAVAVPSGGIGNSGLLVTGSQFNNTISLYLNAKVQQLMLANNLFYVPANGSGVIMENAPPEGTVITGNYFTGLPLGGSGTGIVLFPTDAGLMGTIISGNGFFGLQYGLDLRANVNDMIASSNLFRSNTLNILSAATSSFNTITGRANSAGPAYAAVTGAASNGGSPAAPRVTVNSTTGFVSGQSVLVGGATCSLCGIGPGEFKTTSVIVVDSTHMDLVDLAYQGTYTSGGSITSLPP